MPKPVKVKIFKKLKQRFFQAIILVSVLAMGFCFGYSFCQRIWENRKNVLPEPYRDWFITKEMYLDVDGYNQDERLVAITNKLRDVSSISKVLILKDRQFIEVLGRGASIIWWDAGDFNRNGRMELIVQYDNYGSGDYLPWFLYEWKGGNFQVILQRENPVSRLDIRDMDGDDREEILENFRPERFQQRVVQTFKWDDQTEEYFLEDSVKAGF